MKLPLKFSTGIDGIPAFIIKGCGDILLPVLVHFFNLSLRSHVFPDLWKQVVVVPVYKSGPAIDSKNYRPISLLCLLAKIFDSIMHSHVDSKLTSVMDFVVPVFEGRGQVDVLYLDLAKAFDRLSHGYLFDKLEYLGLPGNIVGSLRSYLTGRSNILKCNGTVTDVKFPVSCGIPQGSSLGPLLFNIHLNDLQFSVISSTLQQFADDNKIFKEINNISDCVLLQKDLDSVAKWCVNNNLPINPSKSVYLTFTRRIRREVLTTYSMDNSFILRKSIMNDLGVLFDRHLLFREQTARFVNRCRRTYAVTFKL